MDFYNSISDYYDEIFPAEPDQINFIANSFPYLTKCSLLDMGCATGQLTMALAPKCLKITGIDLNRKMIQIAEEKSFGTYENVEFIGLDMSHLETHFGVFAFDGIFCFGNTLVHLHSPKQIMNCLSHCKAVLKHEGKFLLQIINYDFVLEHKLKQLPVIETENLIFERKYGLNHASNSIYFATTLHLKKTNKEVSNVTQLYPIRQHDLHNILLQVGFSTVKFYSNYNREPIHAQSRTLIVEAS